jgi:transmembrane sensor
MTAMDNDKDIKAAAREWLLRLSLESSSEDVRAQFVAWCAQDPQHAAAYRRFESIWRDAATLQELKPLAALEATPAGWWRRAGVAICARPTAWAAGAGLAALVAGMGLWLLMAQVRYATGLAEVREIHLSDGSEVTLGARSSLEVAFRIRERRVALTSGVAFFSVSKNASRRFIVTVGEREVRVVGTKFEIRRDTAGMRVSVVEGTVEVIQRPGPVRLQAQSGHTSSAMITEEVSRAPTVPAESPTEAPQERILTTGQQVTAALVGAIPDPQSMPRGEPAAWRHGRLVYVDAPLKDVIADANRYSREPIAIIGEGAANLRVSVTYPSDRIGEMLTALSRSLSLDIERRDSGIVLKFKERSRLRSRTAFAVAN